MLQLDFLTLCIVIFLNLLTVSVVRAVGLFCRSSIPRRFGGGLWDADILAIARKVSAFHVLAGGNDVR